MNDPQLEAPQHPFTLSFTNRDLERSFRAGQEDFLRTALRSGIISSLILWSVSMVILYFVDVEDIWLLTGTIIGVLFPYFLFLIYTTYRQRFTGYFHPLAASSNLIAGLLLVVVLFRLHVSAYAMLTGLIFLIFFGLYSYRFRWMTGFLLSFMYVACFQFYILTYAQVETIDLLFMTFYAWATVGFSVMVGRTAENSDRLSFLAHMATVQQQQRADDLLLNILPKEVADELKEKGHTDAVHIDHVTVLFTDFKEFTAMSEKLTPKELVKDLHECFSAFDAICEKYHIEKIKTIGDAYMAASGVPSPESHNAENVVNAALEMRQFVETGKRRKVERGLPYFEIRVGIHTGPVVAGIVGIKKFQYDIWGDTVNTASRMESSGEVGKVNISETTYQLVMGQFACEARGEVEAKGKGKVKMYFVERVE